MSNSSVFPSKSGQQRTQRSSTQAVVEKKRSFLNELDVVPSGRVRVHKDGARPVVFRLEPLGNAELDEIEPIEEEEEEE